MDGTLKELKLNQAIVQVTGLLVQPAFLSPPLSPLYPYISRCLKLCFAVDCVSICRVLIWETISWHIQLASLFVFHMKKVVFLKIRNMVKLRDCHTLKKSLGW